MTWYTSISTGTNLRSKAPEYIRRVACTCVFQVISFPRIHRSILNIDDSHRDNFAELFRCESSDSRAFVTLKSAKREREIKARARREVKARGKMHSAGAFSWKRKWKCVENRRSPTTFLRLHILRVPVETYHCMISFCIAIPPWPMEIAQNSWTFFTPPFSSLWRPIPFAFYSFHVSLGLLQIIS